METLRLGVVGGGINSAIGKVHILASQLDNAWEVVGGVFSRDPETNLNSGKHWGVAKVYPDIDSICGNSSEFDAVCVLTPTPNHFAQVSKLLHSGMTVISEKSLAMNSDEAESLLRLSENTGKRVFTTYNYSGYPMVREMKRQIQHGELGELIHIRIEMPQEGFIKALPNGEVPKIQDWRKVDQGLPTLSLDLGVHTQHLSFYLTNKRIKSLVSHSGHKGWNHETIDFVETLAEFDDGLTGSFFFGKAFLGNRNGLKISIFGTKGSLNWVQTNPDQLIKCSKEGQIQIIDYGSPDLLEANNNRYQRFKAGHPSGFIEAFANVYQDIADAFRRPGMDYGEILMSPTEVKRDLVELEAMHSSHINGKWMSV
jgi:predicted dehydrogenase